MSPNHIYDLLTRQRVEAKDSNPVTGRDLLEAALIACPEPICFSTRDSEPLSPSTRDFFQTSSDPVQRCSTIQTAGTCFVKPVDKESLSLPVGPWR
jgi:hypothetical protein